MNKTYRRNSVIAHGECCDDKPISRVMHINGRYPQTGERSNCKNDSLIYVIKGSGMVAQAGNKSGLTPGNVVRLRRCEPFHLKGQFSVYVMNFSKMAN